MEAPQLSSRKQKQQPKKTTDQSSHCFKSISRDARQQLSEKNSQKQYDNFAKYFPTNTQGSSMLSSFYKSSIITSQN